MWREGRSSPEEEEYVSEVNKTRGLAAAGVLAGVVLLEVPGDEKETVWVAS
jgi:hypothetical protein